MNMPRRTDEDGREITTGEGTVATGTIGRHGRFCARFLAFILMVVIYLLRRFGMRIICLGTWAATVYPVVDSGVLVPGGMMGRWSVIKTCPHFRGH